MQAWREEETSLKKHKTYFDWYCSWYKDMWLFFFFQIRTWAWGLLALPVPLSFWSQTLLKQPQTAMKRLPRLLPSLAKQWRWFTRLQALAHGLLKSIPCPTPCYYRSCLTCTPLSCAAALESAAAGITCPGTRGSGAPSVWPESCWALTGPSKCSPIACVRTLLTSVWPWRRWWPAAAGGCLIEGCVWSLSAVQNCGVWRSQAAIVCPTKPCLTWCPSVPIWSI